MSGKIEVKPRLGKSLDPRYDSYPYWYLEITDKDGTKMDITPSYDEIEKMIIDIILHEFRVDLTRDRKPDHVRWRQWLDDVLKKAVKEAQTKIKDFEIPEIYKKPKRTARVGIKNKR